MKALSIIQPWATLIAIGAKRIETRSWETSYRGPLAIHASKWLDERGRITNRDVPVTASEEPFASALTQGGLETLSDLPSGAVVAIARLVAVRRTQDVDVDGYEREFGDFCPGRFAWMLEDVKPLATPIPCRGQRYLWDLPADVLKGAA